MQIMNSSLLRWGHPLVVMDSHSIGGKQHPHTILATALVTMVDLWSLERVSPRKSQAGIEGFSKYAGPCSQ